jgi:hypothetical protein
MTLGAHPKIEAWAQKLLELKKTLGAQRLWLVEHYEALGIAEALARRGEDYHLSVHDDPPYGLIGRSRRYFPFKYLCEAQFARVLKAAGSIDTTSWPMGARYKKRYGVESTAYFPYIKELCCEQKGKLSPQVLRVGFLGTLYTPKEPKIFAKALKELGADLEMTVEWHFWGLGTRQQKWVQNLAVPTVIHAFAPEAELLRQAQEVDFFYINYPFDLGSWALRRFSHCAKLSTCLKARRPLFIHTPLPSSIADFVADTGTGVVCPTLEVKKIVRQIKLLLAIPPAPESYDAARKNWYGEENLERLRKALAEKLPRP